MDFICFAAFFKKKLASKQTPAKENFKLYGFLYLKAKGIWGHPDCKHIYTVTWTVHTVSAMTVIEITFVLTWINFKE